MILRYISPPIHILWGLNKIELVFYQIKFLKKLLNVKTSQQLIKYFVPQRRRHLFHCIRDKEMIVHLNACDNTYVKCNRIKSRVKSLITLTWDIKNVACSSTSNIAKCPKFIEELNLIRLSIATCKYQHITVKYLRFFESRRFQRPVQSVLQFIS